MSEAGDRLLYVLSARGELSWLSFKKAFSTLFLSAGSPPEGRDEDYPLALARRQVLRALDQLAHLDAEFHHGQGRVFAAPATLARLPVAGQPRAVLCGARAPGTSSALQAASQAVGCQVYERLQQDRRPGTFLPRQLLVEANSPDVLGRLASRLGIPYEAVPPAWCLACFAGTLAGYLRSRVVVTAPELEWPRWDFDPRSLRFRIARGTGATVRLSRYEDPQRGTYLHFLWNGKSYQEVDLNWGRYALLAGSKVNILAYDFKQFRMAVPASLAIPRLLGRALALCSGFAPLAAGKSTWPLDSPDPHAYDLFENVPPDIAEIVAKKLGQQLAQARLNPVPEELSA